MVESVTINEVGPRDGLQNQSKVLSVAERVRLIEALLDAGVTHVEAGAFVSPKAVPAMADTAEVMAALVDHLDAFSVLIPNLKGYELARAAGARAVGMVVYGSEGMAQANVRRSRVQAEQEAGEIIQAAQEDGIAVGVTVAVAFECPFDGKVDPAEILALTGRLLDQGAGKVVIADTIGAADPGQVRRMTNELVDAHGAASLAFHFHDTRAMGLANVFAALESGVREFDASVGGLGGCPFAPGASGNVATEDVVMMLEQMGFDTGIDQRRLARASKLAAEVTGNAPGGRARAWLERQLAVA
jgi:hydroxymethylglutaryl-CoA lyase